MHAEITELLPMTAGRLMPGGRREKSGKTGSCLRHLWVGLPSIAGGCPYLKSDTLTHAYV